MSPADDIEPAEDREEAVRPSSYDLNLLVVLDILLRSRNVTHASQTLRASLPATSRALSKLRKLFNDPLLVRSSRSFDLTPLAETLTPKVEAFLVNVDKIFGSTLPSPEKFAVVMPDHLGLSLNGRLTAFLRETSPTTVFLPFFNLDGAMRQLEQGQVDLAVGVVDDAPPGFYRRALPPVPTLCLGRKGHEAARQQIPFSEFKRFPSIRICSTFTTGFDEVRDGLEQLRVNGGEVLTVPDIYTAAHFVEDTDALLVLPTSTARLLARNYNLETFQPWGETPDPFYQVSLIWHERWNRRSLHAGVRSVIASHILADTV